MPNPAPTSIAKLWAAYHYTFNGKPSIIASEVKKGKDVLTLRDSKGVPLWSGWNRHGMKSADRALKVATRAL